MKKEGFHDCKFVKSDPGGFGLAEVKIEGSTIHHPHSDIKRSTWWRFKKAIMQCLCDNGW